MKNIAVVITLILRRPQRGAEPEADGGHQVPRRLFCDAGGVIVEKLLKLF